MELCIIGDWKKKCFAAAQDVLESHQATQFEFADDALKSNELSSREPVLIVLAQSARGQFSQPAIDQLSTTFPRARIVVMLGSWCEGETRSGSPLSGVSRLYAAEFAARIRRLENPFAVSRAFDPNLGDEEKLLAQAYADRPQGKFIVVADDLSFAESIRDSISHGNRIAIATRIDASVRISNVDAIVYDANPNRVSRRRDIKALSIRYPSASIVALCDFPRGEECVELESLGVASVLPKPFSIDDLSGELARLQNAPLQASDRRGQATGSSESAA